MREIAVSTRAGAAEDTAADTRVVGLFEGESLLAPALQTLVDLGEARPGLKKVAVTHEDAPGGGQRRVLIAGLGKRAEFDAERARIAAAAVAGRARELGAVSLSWALPPGDGIARRPRRGHAAAPVLVRSLQVQAGGERARVAGGRRRRCRVPTRSSGRAIATDAANRARDLQNLPSNVATPSYLAQRAAEIADQHQALELELLDRDAIVARGMGAFAAVAQGTYAEPRLIVLRYRPPSARGPHLGFVGKAVTFDSGGISIKPASKMHEMKFDMSGGAAVIEAMDAIARLGLPATITAVVPATENMPSGRSMKPGDIVTAMNGTTIEINNTDAEGRLILADALAYAVEQGAERIVDLATLTGAVLVALGHTYAGLFSNDDAWYGEVEAACERYRGGRLATAAASGVLRAHQGRSTPTSPTPPSSAWRPPATRPSSCASSSATRPGCTWTSPAPPGRSGAPYAGKGASGFGVRTLVELARRS